MVKLTEKELEEYTLLFHDIDQISGDLFVQMLAFHQLNDSIAEKRAKRHQFIQARDVVLRKIESKYKVEKGTYQILQDGTIEPVENQESEAPAAPATN